VPEARGRVTPFEVAVPEADLEQMRARIRATRWPDAIEAAPWTYGFDRGYLQRLAQSWSDGFGWREQEALINATPQYLVETAEVRVHASVAGDVSARPLLLLSGWPSTFFEHHRVVPLLTAGDAFRTVCCSLPGFGFSERPRRPGMSARAMAGAIVEAMTGLGHRRFGVHATDFGARVAAAMAHEYPDQVAGLHLCAQPSGFEEQDTLWRRARATPDHMAYYLLQSTRPQTLTYAMNDSPMGMAAWILERWRDWSDCGGEIESRFTRGELLTTVSIYWLSQTFGSAARLYFENRLDPPRLAAGDRVTVPTGISLFPHPPRPWLADSPPSPFNIVYRTEMPSGGHFPALEEPELLASEIRAFFESIDY